MANSLPDLQERERRLADGSVREWKDAYAVASPAQATQPRTAGLCCSCQRAHSLSMTVRKPALVGISGYFDCESLPVTPRRAAQGAVRRSNVTIAYVALAH